MANEYEDGFIARAFLPFGAIHERHLRRVLSVLSELDFFRPTFVGIDERKRVKFELEETIALSRPLAEQPPLALRPLYLWHRAMDRDPDSLHLRDEAPSSLSMTFVGAEAIENGEQIFAEFSRLVSELRPSYASIGLRTNMAKQIADRTDLLDWYRDNPAPATAPEIYYAGLGRMSASTWVDGELGRIMQPALAELGAVPTESGGWRVQISDTPWTATALETAEYSRRTGDTLKKHGLQGKSANPRTGPIHTAPNWQRPSSWKSAADPRLERKIAGVNA